MLNAVKSNVSEEKCRCPFEPHPIPRMESFERVTTLPLVEAVKKQSAELYHTVKDYNYVLSWTLDNAEVSVNRMEQQSRMVLAPIVKRLEVPLGVLDKSFCKILDVFERAVPCIKQDPSQIRETTKTQLNLAVEQVQHIKDLGCMTANTFLDTPVGNVLLKSIDAIAASNEKILDFILPLGEPLRIPTAEKVIQALVLIAGIPKRLALKAYEAISHVLLNAQNRDISNDIRNILTLVQIENLLDPSSTPERNSSVLSTPPCNVNAILVEPVAPKSSRKRSCKLYDLQI